MENCKHPNFEANCAVARLTENDNSPVTGFCMDIKVKCMECGQPFEFVGVQNGYSKEKPMASIDFTELRIPIRPSTGKIGTTAKYQLKETPKTDSVN